MQRGGLAKEGIRFVLAIAAVVAVAIAAWGLLGLERRTTATVALEVWSQFYRPAPERFPREFVTTSGASWGDWVGSERCAECHAAEYERWKGSFHSRTLYRAVAATVFGDFDSETPFDDPMAPMRIVPHRAIDADGEERLYMTLMRHAEGDGRSGSTRLAGSLADMTRTGERLQIDTYGAGVPSELDVTIEVAFAFGNRQHQPYVGRWPDGQHWVMPIVWDGRSDRWIWVGFRPYVQSCASCHVTGIRSSTSPWKPRQRALPRTRPPRYNLEPAEEGWADGSVGCEACHGTGRTHVEAVEEVGVERYRELLEGGRKNPTIYDGKRGSTEQRVAMCDPCHDFHTESLLTWQPGPFGHDRAPLKDPISANPGNIGWQFYPDCTPMSPCTMGSVFRQTKMFEKNVVCSDCHEPHGSERFASLVAPTEDNHLCLSCHVETMPDEVDVLRHTRHAAGSPGNRCVECHMPRLQAFTNGVVVMSEQIHMHSFSIPTGEPAADGAPPETCNICHADRSRAWTHEVLERWRAEASARDATAALR